MRLMETDRVGTDGLAWVCLYCGAESASSAGDAVRYCDCRSEPRVAPVIGRRVRLPAPRVGLAA